ncbi:type II secretory pathway pseudopilin PulG [Ereboglobus sp. PH5-5]|nr:type II secretory pathway pseudopilin PulG [Ereboglobus sp. PH5-5]
MKIAKLPFTKKGFTLVEVIAILTMIGILVGVMAIPAIGIIERARFRAEQQNLSMLANEVKLSFRQDDFGLNLSALEGDMPADYVGRPAVTKFDDEPPAANEMVNENAWYGRLTKLRGQPLLNQRLSASAGDVYNIAHNAYNQRRVMLVGPYEKDQQRYIILSFMFLDGPSLPTAPGNRVILSGGVYSSETNYENWFNAIYSNTWGEAGCQAPTGWASGMQTAWNATDGRNRTFAERTFVERIVQPRYKVTVNNNTTIPAGADPLIFFADRIYIYSNMPTWTDYANAGLWQHVAARAMGAGVETVQVFPGRNEGILEGRRVVIRRQANAITADADAAVTVVSVLLNENTTYTAQ